MNKRPLLTIFIFFALAFTAQAQLTSLNENFNSCPSGNTGPSMWSVFNPIAATVPDGEWMCGATYGRSGTPGISCTGYYGGPASIHLDTSILVSPPLDLSGYIDSIYLNFDTKTTNINLGAKLQLLVSGDSAFADTSTHPLALRNIFDNDDSTNWVTHQANLTLYKYNPHLFIGFRYTSAPGGAVASRWFLDNVITTITRLPLSTVQLVDNSSMSFRIVGNTTADQLTIACNTTTQREYELSIYDLTGRRVHNEQMTTQNGSTIYTIKGLQLSSGMYIVKMGSQAGFAVAKAVVQ